MAALAVVAEHGNEPGSPLATNILTSTCSANGLHQFLLIVDGKFQVVEVDNQLPLAPPKSGKATTSHNGEYVNTFKYAKSVDSQLWAPLLEKAYAKIHGSYKAISGGWIAEALFDLTGWPTESISFNGHIFDSEQANGLHPRQLTNFPTRQSAHAPTRPRAHAPTRPQPQRAAAPAE